MLISKHSTYNLDLDRLRWCWHSKCWMHHFKWIHQLIAIRREKRHSQNGQDDCTTHINYTTNNFPRQSNSTSNYFAQWHIILHRPPSASHCTVIMNCKNTLRSRNKCHSSIWKSKKRTNNKLDNDLNSKEVTNISAWNMEYTTASIEIKWLANEIRESNAYATTVATTLFYMHKHIQYSSPNENMKQKDFILLECSLCGR